MYDPNFPSPKIEPRHIKEALERFARQRRQAQVVAAQLEDSRFVLTILNAAKDKNLWYSVGYETGFYISDSKTINSIKLWQNEDTIKALINQGYIRIDDRYIPSFVDVDRLVDLTEFGWNYYDDLTQDFTPDSV